jgi:hypothetical protein
LDDHDDQEGNDETDKNEQVDEAGVHFFQYPAVKNPFHKK